MTGRQWSAAGQTTSGIGWAVVQAQRLMRDENKTLRRSAVERNLPSSCEKHSRVSSCSAETSLHTAHCSQARQRVPTRLPLNCLFTLIFPCYRLPSRHSAHMLTLGQSNWKTVQIFQHLFSYKRKNHTEGQETCIVSRLSRASRCPESCREKRLWERSMPALCTGAAAAAAPGPPPWQRRGEGSLPPCQGGGSWAQGSKVALENWIYPR